MSIAPARRAAAWITRLAKFRAGTLTIVVLALIALAYMILAIFGPKPPPRPDATWTRIVADGMFRIGVDPSFPPFESDDGTGHLTGFDVALAQEIVSEWTRAERTSIRVHYVYTGFDGLYDALLTGQYDAILSALPYDPKKTEDVRFAHAYFNGGPFVIVRETDTRVGSFQDLVGQRIGVELGASGDGFARKWQRRLKYELEEFNTASEALDALRQGRVDAVFTDAIAYYEFLRARGGVKAVGKALVDELYVIAVRKDSPTLLREINAIIDAMQSDGRLEQLKAQWF